MTTTSFSRNVTPPRRADQTCGFKPFPITTLRYMPSPLFQQLGFPLLTIHKVPGRQGPPAAMPGSPHDMRYLRVLQRVFLLEDPHDVPRDLHGDDVVTNTDTTATSSSVATYTTTTGASVATKTDLAVPGPTSQTAEGGGEASIGAVAGSIIGALALMGMLLGAALFMWIRSRKEKSWKRDIAESEAISPVTGPDGITIVPYQSCTSVSAPPSYDGRPLRGTGVVASKAKSTPPKIPVRSPERKINVTESGWI
ncbi:hypothetical protein CSUB01_05365 [Colletotrichum sublineola]|uniref:Uncharacterized protein n=1 Tax=Colletotrichum sublineola TaxID=1173701 RepID=A0A066XJR7_COLSU|nr:hypothetical protein CSUB01_05365 [Colletotrichum sublineola]